LIRKAHILQACKL